LYKLKKINIRQYNEELLRLKKEFGISVTEEERKKDGLKPATDQAAGPMPKPEAGKEKNEQVPDEQRTVPEKSVPEEQVPDTEQPDKKAPQRHAPDEKAAAKSGAVAPQDRDKNHGIQGV
jgi:hypothetical protein